MDKGDSSKKRVRKILLRSSIALLSVFALLLIIIAIVLNTIVTPRRITPIVLELANEYVNGEVTCESIDITFFSTFPDLGIRLQNGSISQTDTLLAFDNLGVALNPLAFVLEKKVIIHQLDIENAEIYAHVDTLGQLNWETLLVTDNEKDTKEDSTGMDVPELNVKSIRLRNVNLTYDNLYEDTFVMLDSLNLRLRGNLSKDRAGLSLGIRIGGVTSYFQGQTFTRDLPFSFRTKLERDRIAKTLAIERGSVTIGSLELKANGMLKRADTLGVADVDIDFTLNATSLSDVIEMIPEHVSEISSKLIAEGKINSKGKMSGRLGRGDYPLLTLDMQLDKGTLAFVKHKDKPFLEQLDIELSALVDLSKEQASLLNLTKLYLQTSSSKLMGEGTFNNLLTAPDMDIHAAADINFAQLSKDLTFVEGVKMGGMINFDISSKCLFEDILSSNYGKIDANGVVSIKNVMFEHLEEDLSLYASNADMRFGSNTKDSIRGELRESLLRGNLSLDSLNLNWKKELLGNTGKVTVRFSTSQPKDSSSIAPMMANVSAQNVRLKMGDSIRVRAVKARGTVGLRERAEYPELPEINTRLSLDSLIARTPDVGGRLEKANLNLRFSKQRARQRASLIRNRALKDTTNIVAVTGRGKRQYAGRDSTLTRVQRDSIRKSRIDPATNLSLQVESEEVRSLLRKWEVTGGLSSKDLRMRTPYFPIPIRLSESEMTFSSNTLSLAKAAVRLGSSDFTLSGEVEGIRSAALYNGKVTAKMNLMADSLNFNEIIRAAVAGSEYSQMSFVEKDSVSGVVLDESKAVLSERDSTEMGIFVIPRNLDLEFDSHIKNARYGKIAIKNTRGKIILRDQAVYLPRFVLNTDIGSANMRMVYKAANTRSAHLGLDLEVKKIDVKELIDAMPVIDELTPMLRSFEGVVDCNMTAVTELDSVMNVVLPETSASCYMSGKNLVLLDGETFTEISKMLMFKNKNRNLIDSVSVEMIFEDEKLMIFPFQISMDRYNAAVGGVQNLDMSFDYHITVLKSPVPFKLGLNISGNPDKMKIRLGKAKYKNLFTVAKEKKVDNTVINLRKEMDRKLRESIGEIVGADISASVRKPRVTISDSLKNAFFELEDTIATSPVDMQLLSDTVKLSEGIVSE